MNDSAHLEKAENETEFMPLAEAAKLTGYTPEYLNLLCRQKKLRGQKIGRNWHTKKEWVTEFLASTDNVEKFEKISEVVPKAADEFSSRVSTRGSEQFLPDSEGADPVHVAVAEEVKKIKELRELGLGNDERGNRGISGSRTVRKTTKRATGQWFKIFAVMSAAVIVLPLLFAGARVAKIYIASSQKNSELASIYSSSQNVGTKISNENTVTGKVAGVTTTQDGSGAILASANFRINSINVGGNTLVLSNGDNQPLTIENIKSDSFADDKKNETSLVVAWETNKMALSELDYSKSGGQNPATLTENSYGFDHSAVVSGLEPGESYVFQIKSKDRWANEIDSDFFGVYTASKPVSVFDLISNAVGEVFGWAIKK